MIFWDRKESYYLMPSKSRKYFLYGILPANVFRVLTFLSFILNIMAALILYHFVGYNLIALGIGFIIFDITMNILEQIIFITIPYITSCSKSTKKIKRRLKRIEKAKQKTEKKIAILRAKYCRHCDYTYDKETCYHCKPVVRLRERKKKLSKIIENEKVYIADLESKKVVNKSEKKKNTNLVEYTEIKESYFVNITKKFSELIEKEKLYFLIGLRKNVQSLSQILSSKPELECTIPLSIYSKLDDMLTISYDYIKLNQEEKKEQLEDIKKFANSLIKETQGLVVQINRIRTPEVKEDIKTLLEKYNKQEESNV